MKHYETLRGSITPQMARAAADNLHEEQKRVSVASLMLLEVLAVKFMDRGESPQIAELVREAGNQNIYERRDQIFASPTDNIGDRVEDELIGRDNRNFYSAVAAETALSNASVQRLARWVAALFAGYIGARLARGNTSLAGIISEMRNERPEIVRNIPARVASAVGISGAAGTRNTNTSSSSRNVNNNGNNWWIWLIIAIIILLIVIFSLRSCNRNRMVNDGVVVTEAWMPAENLMPADTRSGYADNNADERAAARAERRAENQAERVANRTENQAERAVNQAERTANRAENRAERTANRAETQAERAERRDDNQAQREARRDRRDAMDNNNNNYNDSRDGSMMRNDRNYDDNMDRDIRTGSSTPMTRSGAVVGETNASAARTTTQNGASVTTRTTTQNGTSVTTQTTVPNSTASATRTNTPTTTSATTRSASADNNAMAGTTASGSTSKGTSASTGTTSANSSMKTSGSNSSNSGMKTSGNNSSNSDMKASGSNSSNNGSALTFVQHRLPDGRTIDVAQGGCEDCMMMYLNSDAYAQATDEELRKQWIQFDNIDFVHGSDNELSGNSMAQLDNIAQILKSYPDVRIKIGGLADASGSRAVNREISRRRAEYIKKLLVAQGIRADRISTEGFGEDLATVPAGATDAQRAIDRAIAMRFTK